MTVVICGRTGQVARELVARLPRARVLSRAEADLSAPEEAAAAIDAALAETGARAVINAAAYTAVDRAEEEEPLATAVNGASPGAIARICAARDVPFIHISTDYVFDGSGAAPWRPDDATRPLGAYGRSKLAGEAAVRAAGGVHAILRTSWVFSAHGTNFVRTMLRLGAERDSLQIVADQIGGPTPAADIAATCLGLAEGLSEDPDRTGTYHYSGTPDVSWADLAREIFARSGLHVAVEDIPTAAWPTPAQRPLNSRLDCATLEAQFGIRRPDWRTGLAAVVKELAA